jgi:O-antigen/teichoic acid export membrane protein
MRALFGRLGRQTIVYGVGGSALPIMGLITLPVYARVFVPAQYGVLEVAAVGFAAVLVIVDAGMSTAAQRSFYDYNDDQSEERRAALLTALTVLMFLSVVVATAIALLARPISTTLLGTAAHADLVLIVGATVPVATLATYLREVMRLRFRAWHYVTSSMLGAVGAGVAGIVAVTSFHAGISGVLLGLLIGNAIAAIYGIAIAAPDLAGRFSSPELRRMVHYGGPLIPASFALWGLAFLDRIMLSQLGSFSETGQYGVGSRYATLLMFSLATFMTAYVPFMLALWRESAESERQLRGRLLAYVTLALVSGGLLLSLFARELTTVIAPRYDRAYLVVGVLSTGVVLFAIANIASSGIALARRTKYIAAYTAIATLLNVALNLLLIPAWGMLGAATATAAAYALLAVLYYRKAQQLYPTPFLTRRTLTALLVGCPLMAIGALPIEPEGLAVAIKLLTLALFALAIWRLRLLDDEELHALLSLTRRTRSRTTVPTQTEPAVAAMPAVRTAPNRLGTRRSCRPPDRGAVRNSTGDTRHGGVSCGCPQKWDGFGCQN